MQIYSSVEELIGKTPLVQLNTLCKDSYARVLAKLEFFNPAGSIKDRAAKAMLDQAEESARINPKSVIIEPTSGNTGIGLALLAATRGYRTIIVMPDTMSIERQQLMKVYGAEVVLSDGKKGMTGAIEKAQELAKQIPESFIPGQFVNSANVKAHFLTTGPEIWEDTDGSVDILVAGVGTGGTITGVAQYLKSQKPDIQVIAVEPADSPVLSTGKAGSHKLQGIGAGFVPEILDTSLYDSVYTVTTEDSYNTAKLLARKEGLFVGISSGAATWVALQVANLPENMKKTIVVILPDTGTRYLSTPNFCD